MNRYLFAFAKNVRYTNEIIFVCCLFRQGDFYENPTKAFDCNCYGLRPGVWHPEGQLVIEWRTRGHVIT